MSHTVAGGSGVEEETGDVEADGTYLAIAVTSADPGTTWKDSWAVVSGATDDFTPHEGFKLANEASGLTGFWVCVGAKGNPVSTLDRKVRFSVTDWTQEGVGSLDIDSTLGGAVTGTSSPITSAIGGTDNQDLTVSFKQQQVTDRQLVGYTHLTWVPDNKLPAGAYSATVTVTFDAV